ncbi:MAG: MFS transporter [Actinomycetales bacterium]
MNEGWAGAGELFHTRDYRRLLATRVLSQLGDGAFQVGLAGLFFFSPQRETTPAGVAWALTASLLPYTIVGPFAGVLLDRWFRRQVLLAANAVRAVLVLITAGLLWGDAHAGWVLLVVLVCLSVDRFVLAGLGAALPHVVRPASLVLANSITPTLGTISTVVGGGLGFAAGRLFATWIPHGEHLAGAVGMVVPLTAYLGSGLAVSRLQRQALGPDDGPQRAPMLGQIVDLAVGMAQGARHLWGRPPARWSMILTAGIRIGFGCFTILTILLCRNTFTDHPDEGIALVATAGAITGAGAGLAAVLVPVLVRRLGITRWMISCLLAMVLVYLSFAVSMSREVLLGGCLLLGLSVQGIKICVDTTVQVSLDEEYLGRAFSLYDMVFNASFVTAAVLCVLAVPATGMAPLLWASMAVFMLALAVGTGWRARGESLVAVPSE